MIDRMALDKRFAHPQTSVPTDSVLIVEDDEALRTVLIQALASAGYSVDAVRDGAAAVQALHARDDLDIVLLDIGLPLVDGWRILETFGGRRRPAVIVISARGNEQDKIRALDLGADDYLGKPFGADELMARVRAVLRRMRPPREPARVQEQGDIRVDFAGHAVTRAGVEVRLSPTEWLLLVELARNAGTTLDHRTLLQRVWGPQYADERNYLRTFVQRLRAKLEQDPSKPEVIVTAGRHGYRFGPLVISEEGSPGAD
jgi:two-component system, OmpR family, KDP operon response regulator KdpE